MKLNKISQFLIVLFLLITNLFQANLNAQNAKSVSNNGFLSFDTGYTISKIRTAQNKATSYIVASSYEGTIIGVSYSGKVFWKNELSGFMNHDLWCEDITGNGIDEILVANANGTLYCLNNKGELLWEFKQNNAPMYSVCTIKKDDKNYVVCGGYDKSIYYLSSEGKLVKEISSYNYSVENPWQPYPKAIPDSTCHIANFIRKVKKADGKEVLAVHGVIHTMAIQARGSVYLFNPLEEKPYKTIILEGVRPLGELRSVDSDGDGNEELIVGSTGMIQTASLLKVDINSDIQSQYHINAIKNGIDKFGYRIAQPELISDNGVPKYFVLFGARILLVPLDFSINKTQVLVNKYSFNDMWKDTKTGNIILASAQSGGSCISIINTENKHWKTAYENFNPKGKIAKILKNSVSLRESLKIFKAPKRERTPLPVYLMSESIPSTVKDLVEDIKTNYSSPVFLNGANSDKEKWDRSGILNQRYRERRDGRMKYILSQDEILEKVLPKYENAPGISYWGGHGNDPYMYQLSTNKKILDGANGKKTVQIFPELEDHSDNFAYVMEDYFYPLAKHASDKNGQIYVRTKHSFWQANVYLPMWSRLLSGEFSSVFVPSMEETTDKSMELSLASRLGIWTSGATDSWGSRCARDNPSLDRLRQHSHQMLPNHFLRTMVYQISQGAQYLHNFPVDQEYMSMLWELIAKGALYVPKREEIVSFSPVHLSMLPPNEQFLEESSNTKWTTFYNQEFEENNHFVFSHLNGSWPGAPVTDWDFSKYAAGVKDRRVNFLPSYENGLVLITPPQNGVFADKAAPRGKLTDHLHPIYKNIMKEFLTDGKDYFSKDGKQQFLANSYYKTVEKSIKESAKLLPITVKGNVAWVVAQTSPKHLRLTIVDNGYLNPNDRKAVVTFNTINSKNVVDILNGENFETNKTKQITINIPCGMFKFIDIELEKPLQ
ncbi:PQQ-binding-like beta-propeller repeat protein [Lutibacter citreus]|uniref:PQQ-binding-like beta-propeller repeat protein n=1 Tax=Lutibacter citreus TaxID=2138210 RepID=UPI000DBE6D18|nr:PQQ-binding-like beta-propeller repeat protein [Lutibacter citreus]